MSRIVEEKRVVAGVGRARAGEAEGGPKDYLERVAKYVPSEILAGYIAATALAETSKKLAAPLLILIFIVCLAFTPIYIARLGRSRREKIVNAGMATAAFLFWSYSLGGMFRYFGMHDPIVASILLILFSIASGAIVPISREPVPQPTIQPTSGGPGP